MTSRESFKYASLFINKTSNNFLWRSVIYDSNCNDSFIYDLNRFINEITFAHELIDIFNDSMMIEKYEIMLVTNHIVGISTMMVRIKSVYWWCSLLLNGYEVSLLSDDDLYVESVNHGTHVNSIRSDYLSISLSRLIKSFVHTLQSFWEW
jgi:hypothetical protein